MRTLPRLPLGPSPISSRRDAPSCSPSPSPRPGRATCTTHCRDRGARCGVAHDIDSLLLVIGTHVDFALNARDAMPGGGRLAIETREVARDAARRVDLVITDMVVPGMSGRAFADALSRERAGVRVLFM